MAKDSSTVLTGCSPSSGAFGRWRTIVASYEGEKLHKEVQFRQKMENLLLVNRVVRMLFNTLIVYY